MKLQNAEKKKIFRQNLEKSYSLLWFVLPGAILLFLFNYMPMGGLIIAFQDYKIGKGMLASEWVGLQNFIDVFTGMDFFPVLKNTIVISFLKIICGFPAPIILALCLNEVRGKVFKSTVQTISYLPHFFSWVVLGGIIMMLFSTTGPINYILKLFGLDESIVFFGDGTFFIIMLIVTNIMQSVGWSAIIYMAAISGVDNSIIEAARIDGAGRFRQVMHVIIPSIIPTIITTLILNMGGILNAGFDQILNLYNPMVYDVADIIDTYVLRKLEAMDYSMGTAVGLFKSVVSMIFVLGTNYITKKMSDDELGIM
ncbi:MAG: sugar ABC transporter permease [Clostridia bacterium]|nr:sugar ABC transporter permease [Clostridia bacterium]